MAGRGVQGEAPQDGDGGEPGDSALTRGITLPGIERSVALSRRFVRETLGSRHPALEKVALAVSELATNAIMHTPSGDGGRISIGITTVGDVVRAEVTNDGTTVTKPGIRRDPDAENGRGILIVDALAASWGVIDGPGTTTVWAEFHASSWHLPMPEAPPGPTPGPTPGPRARALPPGRHT